MSKYTFNVSGWNLGSIVMLSLGWDNHKAELLLSGGLCVVLGNCYVILLSYWSIFSLGFIVSLCHYVTVSVVQDCTRTAADHLRFWVILFDSQFNPISFKIWLLQTIILLLWWLLLGCNEFSFSPHPLPPAPLYLSPILSFSFFLVFRMLCWKFLLGDEQIIEHYLIPSLFLSLFQQSCTLWPKLWEPWLELALFTCKYSQTLLACNAVYILILLILSIQLAWMLHIEKTRGWQKPHDADIPESML